MLPIFDGVRDVTVLSTTLRMLLAVVCGGLIGLEREYKRRPAGFRTHILICLGAATTRTWPGWEPRWWRALASSAQAPSSSPGAAG